MIENVPYNFFSENDKKLIYSYSFAELCDRLQIVFLKKINSKELNPSIEQEIEDILHDIQIHLDEKPMTAEMIKAFTVLTLVNRFIFDNETFVRDADDKPELITEDLILLEKLKESHKANSLRAEAKKHIQNERKERVDYKLNYGKATGFWGITW